MPSIKTVATGYDLFAPLVFIGFVLIAQASWFWAFVAAIAYAVAGPMLLKCPRCGLPTSGRVRTDKRGREVRSRMVHASNPDYCSRCALDFRTTTLGERFG